ncbi:MAG TPA: biotin transporter BioY [bacterium]|nr:biotin transporter BioY [bacterium]
MQSPVSVDLVRPARPWLARLFDLALIAGFSLVIALGAQAAIPLPFTPVPVTLQTLAVLLAGCLLGSTRGVAAVAAYIAEGLAGLPVFAGGSAGMGHLLGPTGGYLVGFLAAAYVTGLLAERGLARTWWGILLTLVVGDLLLYVPGVAWLAAFTGAQKALALGFVPFLLGDALKTAAGWGLLKGVALLAARRQQPPA